jgi:hypothetical protein
MRLMLVVPVAAVLVMVMRVVVFVVHRTPPFCNKSHSAWGIAHSVKVLLPYALCAMPSALCSKQ